MFHLPVPHAGLNGLTGVGPALTLEKNAFFDRIQSNSVESGRNPHCPSHSHPALIRLDQTVGRGLTESDLPDLFWQARMSRLLVASTRRTEIRSAGVPACGLRHRPGAGVLFSPSPRPFILSLIPLFYHKATFL
jgi:hypothetical protein